MAAALDYCMRGVGVPLALLVSPISNSLLPEISRLRSLARMRDAFRLIDRTVALTALAAVAGCGFAILFRRPVIGILFQRGSLSLYLLLRDNRSKKRPRRDYLPGRGRRLSLSC